MSSVITPRRRSTSYSASPKSSPTGPTTRVSAKNDEASEKCTAEPPSSRSRLPVGVSTASNAMDPTTVSVMGAARVACRAMRAIRITECGGPEVLELVEDAPAPEPAEGELLVRVTRAGINFADTHARENSYLCRATSCRWSRAPRSRGRPSARRARGRADRRPAATPSTRRRRGDARSRSPTASPTAPALALLVQGLTAWHLYRTSARLRRGRERRRARRRRRRRLAGRPARPAASAPAA